MATHENLHASCIPYNAKPWFSFLRMKKTQDEIKLTHGLGEKMKCILHVCPLWNPSCKFFIYALFSMNYSIGHQVKVTIQITVMSNS
jgi:hypothetical protein